MLLVLIDDAGFGSTDTFGGPVRTPTLTRVQEMGVTYNRFHVTAVCSPTRAALLTGRNQHRVGIRLDRRVPRPLPRLLGRKPRCCAAFPRILQENGYVTGGFGKWHLTPDNVQGAAGPFDHWPKSWGFDHWWGFLSGAAGQYDPIITQDNSTLGVPEGKDGELYYFPDDLTDKAVEWLHAVRAQDAAQAVDAVLLHRLRPRPAPRGARSGPTSTRASSTTAGTRCASGRWRARRSSASCRRTPSSPRGRTSSPPGTRSTDAQKKLYVRQMEVYAGYQENADWNVGRLLDAVEEMGDLDNTLILYIWGDNGASLEGTTTGSFNEMTFLNGLVLDAEQQLALIDQYGGIEALGGDHTAPHFAAAWAHACNAPFQWGKQVGQPPRRHPRPDGRRLAGAAQGRRRCARSSPTASTSARPSSRPPASPSPRSSTASRRSRWTAPASSTPSTTRTRPSGTRSSTSRCSAAGPCTRTAGGRPRGPTACRGTSRPRRWRSSGRTPTGTRTETSAGSCTTCPTDFSQAHDLAAEHPDKVAELQELWWQEAERNRVLPLMGGMSVIYGILPPLPTVTRFAFAGDVQNIQRGMVPRIHGPLLRDRGRADGAGRRRRGRDRRGRRLHRRLRAVGRRGRAAPPHVLVPRGRDLQAGRDREAAGRRGHREDAVRDRRAQARERRQRDAVHRRPGDRRGPMPKTVPIVFTTYAGMDIGRDNGLVVDLDYEDKAPYAFTGTVKKVVFDLAPHAHGDELALHQHHAVQAVARGAAG